MFPHIFLSDVHGHNIINVNISLLQSIIVSLDT